eukprot:3176089-Amphidinium_carterae.1
MTTRHSSGVLSGTRRAHGCHATLWGGLSGLQPTLYMELCGAKSTAFGPGIASRLVILAPAIGVDRCSVIRRIVPSAMLPGAACTQCLDKQERMPRSGVEDSFALAGFLANHRARMSLEGRTTGAAWPAWLYRGTSNIVTVQGLRLMLDDNMFQLRT